MATTSISSNISDISSYDSRMITITVTGIRKQFVRLANQTVCVPYYRLSQAIRNIHRSGGKIVDVSINSVSSGAPVELSVHNNQSNAELELVELEAPVTLEKVEVAASHNVEEVVRVEPQKTTTPGRSKRQNSSHGSKKKRR